MRKVVEFFVRYPIWANAILVIIVIFGSLSYTNINKSFFPERPPNQIAQSGDLSGSLARKKWKKGSPSK